ncbi:MAG: LptF/LptG family permease [Calditrichaeota bacterium]|nr:LptF/LptG family permease [Candidatus Cloacimonadota bacterium]MCB1046129.1 LptF/LptG family permease [Calditrichota bacterium]MCB9472882.1 LptF/LptG family permease [Candidatus Delongbacteria bacterium]
MSILTRYILKRFLIIGLATLAAAVMTFITVDLMDHLDKFIESGTPRSEIIRYYLLYTPHIVYLISPVALLLTTMFTLGGLVRTSEITAMKASGVNPLRILMTLSGMGLVISLGVLLLGETLVPDTAKERLEIYETRIRKRPETMLQNSGRIYFQNDSASVFALDNFNLVEQQGSKAVWLEFEDGRLARRLDAIAVEKSDSGWVFVDGVERVLIPESRWNRFDRVPVPRLHLDPNDIRNLRAKPEEMNLGELGVFIRRQEQAGAPILRWEVDRQVKMAMPFANLVIVLFGVPIAMRRSFGGIGVGFGISLLCCFLYYGAQVFARNFGYEGLLTPLQAGWLPNVAFMLLTLVFYRGLDT